MSEPKITEVVDDEDAVLVADKTNAGNASETDKEVDDDEWMDVLGSGALMKKTIKEGFGEAVQAGDRVHLRVTTTVNGEAIAKDAAMQGRAQERDFPPAIDLVVSLMSEGEECVVKAVPRFDPVLRTKHGDDAEIEYHVVVESLELMEANASASSRISNAQEKRSIGKDKFLSGDIEGAYFSFTKAVDVLGLEDMNVGSPEWKEATSLAAICHSNAAICCNKLERHDKAVEQADAALGFAPDSAKALHAKTKALLVLERLSEAEQCASKLCEHNPTDKGFAKLLADVRASIRKEKNATRGLYAKMAKAVVPPSRRQGREARTSYFARMQVYLFMGSIAAILLAVAITVWLGMDHGNEPTSQSTEL